MTQPEQKERRKFETVGKGRNHYFFEVDDDLAQMLDDGELSIGLAEFEMEMRQECQGEINQ